MIHSIDVQLFSSVSLSIRVNGLRVLLNKNEFCSYNKLYIGFLSFKIGFLA